MSRIEDLNFSKPAEVHSFQGLLFDMDGTIIDSTEAIVKNWHKIGKELGVDPNVILQTSHGRRSIDVLEIYDKSRANMEYVLDMEARIPREYGQHAVEIPGSRAFLDVLEKAGVPWAIVTSGTRPLVTGWLDVMKLAHPKNLVAAEDVPRGKPDPACYQLGQKNLGLAENARTRTLVLEDAPAGVLAGKAAGSPVVALATTHDVVRLRDAGADWIVRDMRSVSLKNWDAETGEAKIEISDALME
ncbi:glycerol-3-phosphate phosphatase-like protein [Viridothelium virens]|uniref:Glycerol-3-phosphate phosphatase-like protein n=1 Tax=Viridothelium virens TaxID=1048519 RepID=A0A6A6GTV1_VIRVR|nr:glycerol-3-phosphate phosphatase-like protein [Viridothelium virens]